MEQIMPRGVRDAIRGVRFKTEGITGAQGNLLVSPDDVSMFSAFMQAVGLPVTSMTERTRQANLVYDTEHYYQQRSTDLARQYASAQDGGDTKQMAKLRQEWMNVQDARQRQGLPRQPMERLFKASQVARKRTANVVRGVPYHKGSERYAQRVTEMDMAEAE
jgi:hypothetical protein